MEFNLIPQVIIIFSIGVIIFIFGKNIPKMKEMQDDDLLFENKNKEKRKFSYLCGKLTRKMKKDSCQERMGLVWKLLEKSLRKIRIKFLRLDNKIVPVLEKLKKKSVNYNDKKSTFKKEINDDKNVVDESRAFLSQSFDEELYEEKKEISEETNSDKNIIDGVKLEESEKGEKSGINRAEDELQTREIISEEKSKSEDKTEKKEEKSSKEKEYIDLILKSPKNIKAYWKLGIVYSRKKKYKDSISCFRQIIKIDPGYTKAKRKIVDLIKRMRRDKKVDKEK